MSGAPIERLTIPMTVPEVVTLWLASVATMVTALALLRKRRGLPILKPVYPVVVLEQTWCSGKSSQTAFGTLGWARNCLWVAVTPEVVHIGAHFPFNIFMPRFFFALDAEIPLASITAVTEESSPLLGAYLRVAYENRESARGPLGPQHFDLQVRHPGKLADALRAKLPRRR